MSKRSVLILAEGFEEKPYIEKIINFPFISKNYIFSKVINLKGNGNILSKYQYEFQTGRYDIVLVFSDADKGSKQFVQIIEGLGSNLFGDKNKGELVFMFVNPVNLQVVLSHFGDVELNKKSKKGNSDIVYELTNVENYDAKEEQIKEIISLINTRNYYEMKERISKLSTNYYVVPSTNFLLFLNRFENDDTSWIDEINKQIASIW